MAPDRTLRSKPSKTIQLTLSGQPATVTPNIMKRGKGKTSPDRVATDVVLAIKSDFVEQLAERKKNHEYRKYMLKEAKRLWLYETAPKFAITHVVCVGPARVPGQVNDPSGTGNDDFDAGKKDSKYGYPVEKMYRLSQPLGRAVLKERYNLTAPQGWMYANVALVKGEPMEAMESLF